MLKTPLYCPPSLPIILHCPPETSFHSLSSGLHAARRAVCALRPFRKYSNSTEADIQEGIWRLDLFYFAAKWMSCFSKCPWCMHRWIGANVWYLVQYLTVNIYPHFRFCFLLWYKYPNLKFTCLASENQGRFSHCKLQKSADKTETYMWLPHCHSLCILYLCV